ncbi:hypothetical protein VP1G_00752 [Cytospora mali]|uniref:Uncharacterized protein n=1 Tax=Cytospora mali TaxID=578113 RepID=A0A194UNT2_CYTMA|nr:hypothetical protein VP1G_00752 [Valsa mali var. pyri (nom. inval.)]
MESVSLHVKRRVVACRDRIKWRIVDPSGPTRPPTQLLKAELRIIIFFSTISFLFGLCRSNNHIENGEISAESYDGGQPSHCIAAYAEASTETGGNSRDDEFIQVYFTWPSTTINDRVEDAEEWTKEYQASNTGPEIQRQHGINDSTITVVDFDIPVRSVSSPLGSKRKRQGNSTGTRGTPNKRHRRDHNNVVGSRSAEDESEKVHIFPLRQVLDSRIRRRIRRNGLSEEMNTIYSEKRTRRKRTEQELRRLRDEMAGKDAEIERLRGSESSTTVFGPEACDLDPRRIHELERRVVQLKEELSHTSSATIDTAQCDDSGIGMSSDGLWDHDSDDGEMVDGFVDEDEFGNSTVEDLQCSTTPENHARSWASDTSSRRLSGPTLMSPPSTSPTKACSPITERQRRHHIFSSNIKTTANITTCDAALQACIPDPEKETMEAELNALRIELASLNDTLQAQEAHMRKPSEDRQSSDDLDLDLQLDIVMQDLSEKTASLAELQSSLSSLLSLPPMDNEEDTTDTTGQITMLQGLTEALHSVRLELEYMSPGETLPDGADEVLDLAVQRLQDLDEQIRQKDESLREKDVMIHHQDEIIKDGDRQIDERNRQIDERDSQIRHKDTRISALELDIEHLNGNIADLEALARQLGEGEAALRGELRAEREAASLREDAMADTEAKLADVLAQTAALRTQLAEKDMQIIQRDAKLSGLRGEVDRLDGALAEARGLLRAARGDASRDRVAAQNAVVAMRAQLLQALAVGEGFLGGGESGFDSLAVPKEEPRNGTANGTGDETGMEGRRGGERVGDGKGGVVDLGMLPAVPTGDLVTREGGKFGGLLE